MAKSIDNLEKILTSIRRFETRLRNFGEVQDAEFLHANSALIETYFQRRAPLPEEITIV